MRTPARRTLAAAVTAGVLLLAGCDADGDGYDDETGQPMAAPVAQESPDADGCDPSGFGPLSGCGGDQAEPGDNPESVPDAGLIAAAEELVARHEAGHKAAADEYGWSISWMWIRTTDDRVEGRTDIWAWQLKDPQQRLVCLYAGDEAAVDTDGRDEAEAEEILAGFPDDEQADVEAAARAEATRIVSAKSAQIDRDATELLKYGEL